ERGVAVAAAAGKGDDALRADVAQRPLDLGHPLRAAGRDRGMAAAPPAGQRALLPPHGRTVATPPGNPRGRRASRSAKGSASEPRPVPNHKVVRRITVVATRARSKSTPSASSRPIIVASVLPRPPGSIEIAPTIIATVKTNMAGSSDSPVPSAPSSRAKASDSANQPTSASARLAA